MKKIANLRVFPTIAAGMIVGISFIILTDLWLPITVAAVALTVAVGGAVALYKRSRNAMRSAAVFCISFALGVIFGLSAALYANAGIERKEIFESNAEITAKIETGNSSDLSGEVDSYSVVLTDITVDGESIGGKARFYSIQLKEGGFTEGDRICFVGDIKTLSTDVTTPYKASLLADGVVYDITCPDTEDGGEIEVIGNSLNFFDRIKRAVAEKLSANVPENTARFMYAMLFGDSAVVEDSVMSDFSYTGTAHLLAVSGLHVGMLAGALILLLKALKTNVVIRNAIVLAVLIFFCALCGFSPSTVRATVMLAVCMTAGISGLRYDPLSGLSFAAVILLFVSPYNLYSLGFLMSFIAVYGLILFAKPLKAGMLKIKFPDWLASALSATLAANATLLPLIIYVFGDVSLIFALANCIVVPLTGIFFPLYIVALPISFIPYFGWVATAVSLPFTAISYIIQWLSGLNFPRVYFNFTWATIVLWLIAATLVSSISAVPANAKKIITSVLVICFIVSVVVQNANMLSAENKLNCFASQDCVGALVSSEKEGDYIVFHGTLDESAVQKALDAMDKNRIKDIDFIVKYEFTDEEARLLDEYAEEFSGATVYTNYAPLHGYETGSLILLAAEYSVVCNYTYTEIYFGGADVMLGDGDTSTAEMNDCDILLCADINSKPDGAEYLVSDYGYISGGENCLPSDFTFWIDGGRIIKTNKWRFA